MKEHRVTLNEFRTLGQEVLPSRILKELAGVISEPLSIIFEKLRRWRTEDDQMPLSFKKGKEGLQGRSWGVGAQGHTTRNVSPAGAALCDSEGPPAPPRRAEWSFGAVSGRSKKWFLP